MANIQDTTNVFVIKVLGEDEFDGSLDKIYTTRFIKNKPVTIDYIESITEIGHCHVLYIANNRRKEITKILSLVYDKPILTIGG